VNGELVDLAPGLREALAEYEAVCGPAWAEYQAVCDTAWAEYEAVCGPAWAEYQAVCGPALAEYEAVRALAWAECKAVRDAAWAECKAVRDAALAAYEAACGPALAGLAAVAPLLAEVAGGYPDQLAEVVALLPAPMAVLDGHAADQDWREAWVELRDGALAAGVLVRGGGGVMLPTKRRSLARAAFLADIIVTAVEGGIGYWSQVSDYHYWFPQEYLRGGAVHRGGEPNAYVTIHDIEEDDPGFASVTIGVERVAAALARLRRGPVAGLGESLRADIVANDRTNGEPDGHQDVDAVLADAIVQVALFGEVRFG
jgi:hypothetical protein